MSFRGIYAPLATPFDHRGNIYWSKFDYNLSQLLRTKLSGFVVADRWGEGPLLSSEEKSRLWKRAADHVGDAAAVLATVSRCGVSEARDLVADAMAAGCSAAIVEAPDVESLAPGSDNSELFFRAVADASELPLLPDVRLNGSGASTPEQLASLAAHPSIAGVLIEGYAQESLDSVAALCDPDVSILVRDLAGATTSLAGPAAAAVLAIAAVVPFHALSIEEAVRTRDPAAAADLTRRALGLDRLLSRHGVPALKHGLDHRGYYGGSPRLPLLGATPSAREAVANSLYELAS